MKKIIVYASFLLFITGCYSTMFVREFKTKGLPEEEIAKVTVPDTIRIHSIDGEVVNYKAFGTDSAGQQSYYLHMKPGRHVLKVYYYFHLSDRSSVYRSGTGTVTIMRDFLKNGRYFIASYKSSGNTRIFLVQKYMDNEFEKGIRKLPKLPVQFWHGKNVKTEKKVYKIDENIKVYFKNIPGNKKDWITIVRANAPAGTRGYWKYLRGRENGTIMFSGMGSGSFEIRVFEQAKNIPLYRCPFKVE